MRTSLSCFGCSLIAAEKRSPQNVYCISTRSWSHNADLDRHGAQPYRFCFSIISNQPYKKTVCSLNLPFYGSQPMLPVTPLIFGYSSHFMKTPMPTARIFCHLHALSHCFTFISRSTSGDERSWIGCCCDWAIETQRKEIK